MKEEPKFEGDWTEEQVLLLEKIRGHANNKL
jgi:hypothetical protein